MKPDREPLAVEQRKFWFDFNLSWMTPNIPEGAIGGVGRQQARAGEFTPVFVIDNTGLRSSRAWSYVVKFIALSILSDAHERPPGIRYVGARLDLMKKKWLFSEFFLLLTAVLDDDGIAHRTRLVRNCCASPCAGRYFLLAN